jgi:7,8-dihydropterin-6-yl-methyl-4-(beta-D-ribofuranosyl)aminobenzene 5'-phosphate synthase
VQHGKMCLLVARNIPTSGNSARAKQFYKDGLYGSAVYMQTTRLDLITNGSADRSQAGSLRFRGRVRARLRVCAIILVVLATIICPESQAAASGKNQVTILYDAFGKPSNLKKDWGYSALVEYGGKRILFDTGNNAEFFKHNVETLGLDLRNLDFVVISHRHGDHTSGLSYVLSMNPNVTIYAPYEVSGFATPVLPGIMAAINQHDPSLPVYMHYFDGVKQETRPSGSPWPTAHFKTIEDTTEVAPGMFIVSNISDVAGTKEMHEISLALRTPQGLVLIVGCSHPGIEKIVQSATPLDGHIFAVFGGFHLLSTPDAEVSRIASSLHDKWKVERMAPGHCTGLPAFAALRALYADKYIYAGLGSVVSLPEN